jgi:iron complex outermembrane receptor protein
MINSAVYYSLITGKIVSVGWPAPNRPIDSLDYAKNLDRTAFYGFELAPEVSLSGYLNAGLSFSINKYYIYHSENSVRVIPYYPLLTLNAYAVIKPSKALSILPRIEYLGARYGDSNADNELDAYFLAHLKVTADIGAYLSVSAGIENMFDTLYEISQYFPMAGRSFTCSLTLRY